MNIQRALLLLATAGCCLAILWRCESGDTYVTEYGLGPDKWATAWLLTRVVNPGSNLRIVKPGEALPAGTVFDVPAAPIHRDHDRAAFEVALEGVAAEDGSGYRPSELQRLARVVHEIEVDFWSHNDSAEAVLVEHAFRELQRRYGRDQVSPACYLAFFDRVYQVLEVSTQERRLPGPGLLTVDCELPDEPQLSAGVLEVSASAALSAMARGELVVFVDVREPEEFAEGHIPGAINLTLSALDSAPLARLRSADWVISYCVKDFRGFEMAKALANAGVARSAIMRPYGIKGWLGAGLPITGPDSASDAVALTQLRRCAQRPALCGIVEDQADREPR